MIPGKEKKLETLKRILKILDGNPETINYPDELLFGFKKGYRIPQDDLRILEDFQYIETSEIFTSDHERQVKITGHAIEYEILTIGNHENPDVFVNFLEINKAKTNIEQFIFLIESGVDI